nr:MAG TPA: hypothetical protein [Caudoviricetes sp.]
MEFRIRAKHIQRKTEYHRKYGMEKIKNVHILRKKQIER